MIEPTETRTPAPAYEARGGVSMLSTFTGVLVALGTLFLLSAIVAGVIEAVDDLDTGSGTVKIGIGAGIAFIVAQFIAYLWGGYTAARMGRGAGVAHGLLVPLFALLLAAIVAGIATALGAVANLGLPFTETRLPVERNYLIDWGAGVGIGSLVAMFLGGIIGGIRGASWHSRLEASTRARVLNEDRHTEIERSTDDEPDTSSPGTTYEPPGSEDPGADETDPAEMSPFARPTPPVPPTFKPPPATPPSEPPPRT